MTDFKKEWTVESAMEILQHPTVDSAIDPRAHEIEGSGHQDGQLRGKNACGDRCGNGVGRVMETVDKVKRQGKDHHKAKQNHVMHAS